MSEPTKNQQNSNALPNFMSENGKTSYIEENETPNLLANNLHRLMIWVSIIWFGIVLIYISQFFGWSNLFLMMPDEFGAFLAGVTLPLAIIWVVMAYIDRGTNFKNGGAGTAKAMAEALRAQTVELQQATKEATLQTARIKEELGAHVNDFAKLVGVLDNYSSKTIGELTEGVKTLITSFDYINEKTISFTNKARNSSPSAMNCIKMPEHCLTICFRLSKTSKIQPVCCKISLMTTMPKFSAPMKLSSPAAIS